MLAMVVCVCRRSSQHSITRAARAGMSFDDIQLKLGVATQCGQCESGAHALVLECCSTAPVAPHQAGQPAPEPAGAGQRAHAQSLKPHWAGAPTPGRPRHLLQSAVQGISQAHTFPEIPTENVITVVPVVRRLARKHSKAQI